MSLQEANIKSNTLNAAEMNVLDTSVSEIDLCEHCGLEILSLSNRKEARDSSRFCCMGCEFAYQLISDWNLEEFYQLRNEDSEKRLERVQASESNFKFFDDPEFQARYVKSKSLDLSSTIFYLEGIYCVACVWLIEKLPAILPGVIESRVDFRKARLKLSFNPKKIKLSVIAKTLDSLGYKPCPLTENIEETKHKQELKKLLIRLAVAGVCAGNTMLIAVSLYQGYFSGIEDKYKYFFHFASLFLSLPAVIYSAYPFYRAAIGGLLVGLFHIDLPISLGILLGFSASVWNTLQGGSEVYFDSICMLIFLLLIGRWFQKSSLHKVLNTKDFLFSLAPQGTKRISSSGIEEVFVGSLKQGDEVLVAKGDIIPADGVVSKGSGLINQSVLTGESKLIKAVTGDKVFAGTINLGDELEIELSSTYQSSRMGKLLNAMDNEQREAAPIEKLTDKVSGYFVLFVLFTSLICFLSWLYIADFNTALNTTLSFLIITCPCALGLAAPSALAVAIRKAARDGILLKSTGIIEILSGVKKIFFDKTGTLTKGELVVGDIYSFKEDNHPLKCSIEEVDKETVNAIKELENSSQHPFGRTLYGTFQKICSHEKPFQKIEFFLGKGIKGLDSAGDEWILGAPVWEELICEGQESEIEEVVSKLSDYSLSPVVISKNSEAKYIFGLGDTLQPNVSDLFNFLAEEKISSSLLSGDNSRIVKKVSKLLDIDGEGELSPEDKLRIVETSSQLTPTAMIGDGANDIGALKAAHVGVAVSGGLELSFRSADVFIKNGNPLKLKNLFSGSIKTISIIKRNLCFSFFYNLIGGGAAILGYVDPLVAAVLMPISSLTIVLSSVLSKSFYGER